MKGENMKKMKAMLMVSWMSLMVLGMMSDANALQITISNYLANGDQTSQAQINTAIASYIGTATALYNADDNNGLVESGSLAASYATDFDPDTKPETATITYVTGPFINSQAYLLVKDGNHSPSWYLYDLTALGWTGTQPIVIEQLWPGGGNISHATIYGSSTAVPEPTTMLILGFGLLGLAGVRRRFNK